MLDTLAKAASPEAALQHMAEASTRTGLPIDLDAARAAMMQALGSAELLATPGTLSDAELDTIAGAGTGQRVLNSVLSLGFDCLVASLTAVGAQRDCGAEIEKLLKGDIPPRDGTFRF